MGSFNLICSMMWKVESTIRRYTFFTRQYIVIDLTTLKTKKHSETCLLVLHPFYQFSSLGDLLSPPCTYTHPPAHFPLSGLSFKISKNTMVMKCHNL